MSASLPRKRRVLRTEDQRVVTHGDMRRVVSALAQVQGAQIAELFERMERLESGRPATHTAATPVEAQVTGFEGADVQ